MRNKADMQDKMKTMSRADFFLGAAALLLAVLGFVWLRSSPAKPAAEMIVMQHNKEVLRVPLTDSGEENWTFGEPGRQNTVQRVGKRVRVLQADCPDQICVKQGWIGKAGEQLLCVPNRLLVEIRSKGAETIDTLAR